MPILLPAEEVADQLAKQLVIHIASELGAYWKGKTMFNSKQLIKRVELNGTVSVKFFDKHIRPMCEERGWIVEAGNAEHFSYLTFKYNWKND